jgi:hypothetical protein
MIKYAIDLTNFLRIFFFSFNSEYSSKDLKGLISEAFVPYSSLSVLAGSQDSAVGIATG